MKILNLIQFLSKITNLNQKIMKILILNNFFLLKITNLNQPNMKMLILKKIFIKNHKFESQNHEHVKFESIFIRNHKFD